MTELELIEKIKTEYQMNLPRYQKMQRYFDGNQDINNTYLQLENRSNEPVVDNYVSKFISEEVAYCLGNPLSYVTKSGDKKIIDAIDINLFHWKINHNQELMKQLEIFSTAYALNYIDEKGRFCERILNPTNAIAYCDADGVPLRFIHFYKKKFDESQYYDVYYPDKRIEIYKDNVLIDTKTHIFSGIPVSVCQMDEGETIYSKIKLLQDAYNHILSDQCNTIADFRNAYLVVTGVEVDDTVADALKKKGILNLESKDSSVSWLMKDLPDTYINNMLENLKNAMYSTTNHIDGNFQMQSNTSSLAIRSRLTFLEQRCKRVLDVVKDTVYDRLERLFNDYLSLKNENYDITDIVINDTPCIPQDTMSITQELVQLGDNLSLETKLSLLPYIENPLQEIEKIKKERAELEAIDLDKINGYE